MKKLKKILIVIPIIAILICSICLPVSADSSYEALPITVTKVWTNYVDDNTYTQWDTNYYNIKIPYYSGKNAFASLWTVNNDDTTNYYNYKFKFRFMNMEPTDFTLSFNGVTYEVQKMVVDEWETYYYVDIHDIKLKNPDSRLDFGFSFTNASDAAIYFQAFYQYSDLNPVIDNQNENTDKIIENQNSNTQAEIEADKENTQAIIDNQNQLAEQEKQEVADSGNDSVDSTTEAIPDYDFFEAIGVFVNSLGSTDTECIIDIPRIYIPKVAMLPETTLYNGGTLNFNTVIDMIPDTILLLVQYILTVALIIYGCKEFYDLIFKSVDGVSKIGDDT